MNRRVGTLVVVLLVSFLVGMPAAAQEEAVRESVRATLAAWSGGDFDGLAEQYHPDVRGFFLEGGPLTRGFQIDVLRAAWDEGLRAEMSLRDLDVQVHGNAAASVAYLDGSIAMPGGLSLSGSWRYSETRVLVDGAWKVVQYHFSQMAPGP